MQSQLLTIYGRVDRAALLANFECIWRLSAVRNRFLIKGLDVWFLHPHSEKREVPRGHRFSRGTRWDAVRHPMFFTCLWDAKSVPQSSSSVWWKWPLSVSVNVREVENWNQKKAGQTRRKLLARAGLPVDTAPESEFSKKEEIRW